MGNCLRRESSLVWADDECDSVAPPGQKIVLYDAGNDHRDQEHNVNTEERHSLLGEVGNSSGSNSNGEVKIKIAKRELEELMKRVDMQGLTTEELLARLLDSSDDSQGTLLMEHDHHRSWKPALQSIPE